MMPRRQQLGSSYPCVATRGRSCRRLYNKPTRFLFFLCRLNRHLTGILTLADLAPDTFCRAREQAQRHELLSAGQCEAQPHLLT